MHALGLFVQRAEVYSTAVCVITAQLTLVFRVCSWFGAGRSALIQYNAKKPIKFALRLYSLNCSTTGCVCVLAERAQWRVIAVMSFKRDQSTCGSYTWNLLLHHWTKANKANPDFVDKFKYCASIHDLVMHMAGLLPRHGYTLIMDSFYTHVNTFKALYDARYNAVGSVKEKRGVPLYLFWKKHDRTRQFGDCFHARTLDGKVLLQQWKGGAAVLKLRFSSARLTPCLRPVRIGSADKQVVSVLSTLHKGVSGSADAVRNEDGVSEVIRKRTAKHRGVDGYEEVSGPRPPALTFYSEHMGGTDTFDGMRAHNTVHREAKRWYIAMWHQLLDLAAANSFILFKTKHGAPLHDLAGFRAELVDGLLAAGDRNLDAMKSELAKKPPRPAADFVRDGRLPVVYDQHIPITVSTKEGDSRKRCVVCSFLIDSEQWTGGKREAKKGGVMCNECGGLSFCVAGDRNHWDFVHKSGPAPEDPESGAGGGGGGGTASAYV